MPKLKFHLVGGNNIKAADSNGKSDPYIIATLGHKQKFKSKVVKKTLTPVWNETHEFNLREASGNEAIKIELYDRDLLSRDEELGVGYALIGLPALKKGVEELITVDLSPQGQIQIGLLAVDYDKPAFENRYLPFLLPHPGWIVHYLNNFYKHDDDSGTLTKPHLFKTLESIGWDSSYSHTIQFVFAFVDFNGSNNIDVNEYLELQGYIVAVTAVWQNQSDSKLDELVKCLGELEFTFSHEVNNKLYKLIDFDGSGVLNGFEVFNLFFFLRMCEVFFTRIAQTRQGTATLAQISAYLSQMSTDIWPIKDDRLKIESTFKQISNGADKINFNQYVNFIVDLIFSAREK